MINTAAAAPVRTFLISAIGLAGGDVLHLNGETFQVLEATGSEPGHYMRVYFFTLDRLDWLVLPKDKMVKVS